MKTVKILLVFGLVVSISIASIAVFSGSSQTALSGVQENTSTESSFIFHSPIIITGDSDFASQGWPGSGSPVSPYIIESLEISTNTTCISISNTNVHFIIRNCTLSSPIIGVGTGIYLSQVNNGTIENCTLSSFDTGIKLSNTDDSTFSNNTLYNCDGYGLYLNSGLNCTVNNNWVNNCEGYGFFLASLRYSFVEYNNISSCKEMGFALVSSLNDTIIENTIERSGRFGLYLTMSINCTFTNNSLVNGGFGVGTNDELHWNHEFLDNTVNGKTFGYFFKINNTEENGNLFGQVFLVDCFNVSIKSGIFFNASIGVSLFSCTNCTIDNVEISGNLYGINLLQSENTTLTDNTLLDCGVRFEGDDIDYWNLTATGNTINGRQFGYFLNQDNLTIDGNDYGQFVLVDSSNLSITNGTFDSVTLGFVAYSCFNCSIKDSSIVDNYRDGIQLLNSNNCTLTNVTSEGSREKGLYIYKSNNTIVNDCKIYGNAEGIVVSTSNDFLFELNQIFNNRGRAIYLSGTSYGLIHNNSIKNNGGSIQLYVVNWLKIVNNTISGSSSDGIYMDFTSGVIIVDNKIYGHAGYGLNGRSYTLFSEIYNNWIGFNGIGNAIDIGLFNDWDDGAGTGNVWSDYSGGGTYSVGVGVDHYPLGFINRPNDVQYVVGSVVSAIIWDVRLPNPDSYMILWDEYLIAQGLLNSSLEHLSKPIDGLSVGIYNLTIVVNDESGYSLVDTVIITVTDETVTTTTTTTTSTMTSTTSSTGTSATPTNTTLPSDTPVIFVILTTAVIGVIAIIIFVIMRKK